MTRLLTLTLAILIAVTSQQMAMARGMMTDASGQVIICTGEGTITITLDAQGIPIDGPTLAHICPDCTITLVGMGDDPTWAMGVLVHIKTVSQHPALKPQIYSLDVTVAARGPPILV